MSTTWESIEEREERVRGSRTTSILERAGEQLPESKTLKAALAERPFISREDLKRIARHHYERPVITLYLRFTPERLVRSDRPVFLTVFESLRRAELDARKPYIEALPRAQRLALPEDLAEVETFLEQYRPAGERALLIIKCGESLNRVMPLPVRVADSLTIDTRPLIEPLEAIMEEQHRLLLVDLSKEATTFSVYELGYEERIDTIKSFVPTDTVDASRPGKAQRHRLTHLQWHLKASAHAAAGFFRERGSDMLALIGEQALVKEFEDYLPKPLRDRLLTELHLSPNDGPNRRHAALQEALAKQRQKEEEAAVGELGFYQGHGRLAAGLEKVMDAANLFLMRRLFLDDQLAAPGFVCRSHDFMALDAGTCPFDGQTLRPAENVLDELVEVARLHGVDVMLLIERPDLLGPYRGAAAMLVTAAPIDELRTVTVTG